MEFLNRTCDRLKELLSVILPFHNSEKFIKGTLNSLLSQTYSNYKLILINDYSLDSSLNIISSINDSRIIIIQNEGRGAVAAYNTGIKFTKSKYIFIADHDDLFDFQLIEKEYNFLINNEEVSIVSSSFYVIDETDEIIHKVILPSNDAEIKEKLKYQSSIVNSGSMIKKSVFDNFGYFAEKYFPAHDYEFYLRVSDKVKFHNLSEYLIRWRAVSTAPSQQRFPEQMEKGFIAIERYLNEKYNIGELSIGEYYFNLGRAVYYRKSVKQSITYFYKAIFHKYLTKNVIMYFLKSIFLWIPIKFYRDWLVKAKFKKKNKFNF